MRHPRPRKNRRSACDNAVRLDAGMSTKQQQPCGRSGPWVGGAAVGRVCIRGIRRRVAASAATAPWSLALLISLSIAIMWMSPLAQAEPAAAAAAAAAGPASPTVQTPSPSAAAAAAQSPTAAANATFQAAQAATSPNITSPSAKEQIKQPPTPSPEAWHEVDVYPRLLPGPGLTSEPDPRVFEVYPGCRTRSQGLPGLPNFVAYCVDAAGKNVSYWHDVPLNLTRDPQNGSVTLWITNEIPKGTNAKIQTVTTILGTPMAQDVSAPSVMRYYRVGPSLVNYGGIPQTWEASDEPDPLTGRPADNDPVDFLEIGSAPMPVGAVVRVKLLGALSLVDQGETDWKVVVLQTRDGNASSWNDISDVPPHLRRELFHFFRTYKVAEGKLPNVFYPNGHTNCSDSPNRSNGTAVTGSRCAPSPESQQQMLGTDPLEADWKRAFFGRDDTATMLEGKHKEWRRLLDGGCVTNRCAPLVAAAGADAAQGAGVSP